MRFPSANALRNGLAVWLLSIVACLPAEHRVEVNLDTGTGQVEVFQGGSKVLYVRAKEGTIVTYAPDPSTGLSVSPNPVQLQTPGVSNFVGLVDPSLHATATSTLGTHQFKVSATNTNNDDTKTEIVPIFATVLEPFSFSAASNATVSGRIGQTISGSATVNIHPDFSNQITYTIVGLPQGLSYTIVPTRQGVQEVLDYNISGLSAISPGTYSARIEATWNGVVKSAALNVLVLVPLPVPDFTISVVPSAVLMQPTATAIVDITLSRTGTPAIGAIDLAVPSTPATGVTATLSLTHVTNSTSRLTLVSNGAPPAGPIDVVITAMGGSVTRTAVVKLTIAPTMVLTALPSSITVSGVVPQTIDAAIQIARVGPVGDVTFSVQGVPSGVTPTFTQSVVSTASTTLRFTVDALPLPGTYPVVVTGTGQSGAAATVNISLVVPAATGTFTPAFSQLSFSAPQNSVLPVQLNLPRTGSLVGAALGVTVTASPPLTVATPLVPSTTANVLPINLTIGAAPIGSHTLTVSVTDGATVRTATTTIVITTALPTAFVAAFQQSSYSIPFGPHLQNFNINIIRTAALVGVPLTTTIASAPTGAFADVVTPVTTSDATVVGLTFNGSTPVGAHAFTVRITDGTTVWTATTTINITAPMESVGSGLQRQERQHPH